MTDSSAIVSSGYLGVFRPVTEHDEGNTRTTTSTTYVTYTNRPSVTILVPDSGMVKVEWGGSLNNNSAAAGNSTRVSIDVTGANSIGPSDDWCARVASFGTGLTTCHVASSRSRLYTGLTVGSTTFSMQMRTSVGTDTATIFSSWLIVTPIP